MQTPIEAQVPPQFHFCFQGIDIQKLIEAGQFISKALGRHSNSKVAQATKSSL